MQVVVRNDAEIKEEPIEVKGEIFIRKLPPGITIEEFVEMWSKLTEKERDRYTDQHVRNIITTAGRTQILTFIGNPSSNTAFSQWFAVGTTAINVVNPGDASLAGESFRLQPTLYSVSGNSVDVSTFFNGSQGNGTLTNCGLFGVNATSTSGSGTLMTHAILNNYNKANGQTVTFDYLITLN